MTFFVWRISIAASLALALGACSQEPHCAGATAIAPVVGAVDDATGDAVCNVSFTVVDVNEAGTRNIDDGGVRSCDADPTATACMMAPVPDGGGRCDYALTGVGVGPGMRATVIVSSPGYASQAVTVTTGVQSLCGEIVQNASRAVVRLVAQR